MPLVFFRDMGATEAESKIMDALGINLSGLLTQLVSFLLLFGLLYIVLYKPILRMLDQRGAKIKESLEIAERARDDAARSEEAVEAQLNKARADGQAMIVQAREVAERFREEEMAKIKAEIATERERAEASIQRERDSAVEELRSHFADLAITAAEQVISRSLDEDAHRELINQVLEEGSNIGGEGK